MERFGEGDNVLLGHRHPKSFENTDSARWDIDFNDVFGGPPRRYSMQEMRLRYSFNEALTDSEDDAVFTTRDGDNHHPWSGLNEKPVFGEESVNRRRYVSGDFFDDIFNGDESFGSPRTDRDTFGSAPGSRVLSPARPLPPRAEPFSSSLPAQFSLPAKLTASMDSPVFASGNSSPDKSKDGILNVMSNPHISKASSTKFLNRAINGKNEARGDRQNYRQSPLSREVFLTNAESAHVIISDEKDKGSKLENDTENLESPDDGKQFHFSIYKWAGVGVPLMVPLRAGKSSKLEQKSKVERSTSSNGRIETNDLDNERSQCAKMDSEPASAKIHTVLSNVESKSSEVERENDDKRSNKERPESYGAIKDANLEVLESNLNNGLKNPATVGKSTMNNRIEELLYSQKLEIHNKLQKEVHTNVTQVAKPEMKSLRAVLSVKVEAQGNSIEENETAAKDTRTAKAFHIGDEEKKNDARRKSSNKFSVNKDGLPVSPTNSGNSRGKSGVKGKVKDFIKFFNQETIGKSRTDVDTRSQSSRWKSPDVYGIDDKGSRVHKINENVQPAKVDNVPNAFTKADENTNNDSVENPSKVNTSNNRSSRFFDQKNASSFPDSFHGTSKVTGGKTEDINQANFAVEELCHDPDKGLQNTLDPEDIQASNAKIQQWAHGRKGNIRSLLSTLQYVLWPESGWKPVPLVNIIEGSAVKRIYQRALLCLHPDKLQQKDASPHQKYIAEKVFDILQEAWDHFNSLGGI